MPHYWQVGVEVQAPHKPVRMKVPAFYLALSDTTQWNSCGTAFQPDKGASPGSSFDLCWHEWRWDHSFFWVVCLKESSLWSVFCLDGLPLSWSFDSGELAFVFVFVFLFVCFVGGGGLCL